MKRKSKENASISTVYNPFDLFGEISVTQDEIALWCIHVAKMPLDSPRLAWYVRFWDVPAKIRAAKRLKPLHEYLGIP